MFAAAGFGWALARCVSPNPRLAGRPRAFIGFAWLVLLVILSARWGLDPGDDNGRTTAIIDRWTDKRIATVYEKFRSDPGE
jgi:hypothetical protein